MLCLLVNSNVFIGSLSLLFLPAKLIWASDGPGITSRQPVLRRLTKRWWKILGIAHAAGHAGVTTPFMKGLDHYLRSLKNPALLSDVVTEMYEALEALAKIVCGNDKGINANRDAFIAKLGLPDSYNKILREYIEYANTIRHAGEKGQAKTPPSRQRLKHSCT